jgi:hypothetical protein
MLLVTLLENRTANWSHEPENAIHSDVTVFEDEQSYLTMVNCHPSYHCHSRIYHYTVLSLELGVIVRQS